jgi:hypothetical protein
MRVHRHIESGFGLLYEPAPPAPYACFKFTKLGAPSEFQSAANDRAKLDRRSISPLPSQPAKEHS